MENKFKDKFGNIVLIFNNVVRAKVRALTNDGFVFKVIKL